MVISSRTGDEKLSSIALSATLATLTLTSPVMTEISWPSVIFSGCEKKPDSGLSFLTNSVFRVFSAPSSSLGDEN